MISLFRTGDFIVNSYQNNILYYVKDCRKDSYNRYRYELIRFFPKHDSSFIWPEFLLADFVKADNYKIMQMDTKTIYIKI